MGCGCHPKGARTMPRIGEEGNSQHPYPGKSDAGSTGSVPMKLDPYPMQPHQNIPEGLSQSPPPEPSSAICQICASDSPPGTQTKHILDCTHGICKDCASKQLQSQMTNKKGIIEFMCQKCHTFKNLSTVIKSINFINRICPLIMQLFRRHLFTG